MNLAKNFVIGILKKVSCLTTNKICDETLYNQRQSNTPIFTLRRY